MPASNRRRLPFVLARSLPRSAAFCRRAGRAARAVDGDDVQHPLRHRQGRREPLDARAARCSSTSFASRTRISSACRKRWRFKSTRSLPPFRGYAVVGVGRDDAARAGEYSAILFRKDRLRVAEAGTFWFSDTPSVHGVEVVGQQHYAHLHVDAVHRCRRARVLSLQPAPRSRVAAVARAAARRCCKQRIEHARVRPEPVIVTGDFNVGERNPALPRSSAAAESSGRVRRHVPRAALRCDVVGTFTGFKLDATTGRQDRLRARSARHRGDERGDRANQPQTTVTRRTTFP